MLYTLELLPILIFTFAYALNFINSRFGSLFWLLEVPIGSLFHKKNGSLLGPYLKAKGSLIVLGTVRKGLKYNLDRFVQYSAQIMKMKPFLRES